MGRSGHETEKTVSNLAGVTQAEVNLVGEKLSLSYDEQIIQQNAKRESNLLTQLNDLKKTLKPKELEIASLKATVTEISIQLAEATALSRALKKARDDSMAELESEKAAKAELIKKMDALSHALSLQNK